VNANHELRKFLYQNVYYLAEVNRRAREMPRKGLENYVADSSGLGDAAANRIDQEGLYRTVCDYIAAMTDRYLMKGHARLTS
jgi:dGTPase